MSKNLNRGYNFGAGPATLPEEILIEIQSELLNWSNLGMSILEIGHRTEEFKQVLDEAEELFRKLLAIPSSYKVLFIGSPARLHFSMVPLNFIGPNEQAGYLVTGTWSELALQEASRLSRAYRITNIDQQVPNTAYTYYTPNETIEGLRYPSRPKQKNTPVIADMTSCLLSEPLTISDYGLIFAGAQKNIANAGLTVVIVSNELLDKSQAQALPSFTDYRVHAKAKSLYVTPPTFNCYVALKMLRWLEKQGGIAAIYQKNLEKAKALYDFIDSCDFYETKVEKEFRSLMNVCFSVKNSTANKIEELFVKEAENCGLYALGGHKTVGGLRASLYNAMPIAGVEKLISFMKDFAKIYG